MNAAIIAKAHLEERGLVPRAPEPQREVSLVERAIDKGLPIEVIKEMMDLAERQRAFEARRAFDEAMSLASAEMPVIFKAASADRYKYEDLAAVTEAVREPLSRHGLSFRWRTTQDRSVVRVTCVVSHHGGHYEETALEAPAGDIVRGANAVQQLGAAVTYLQRYTLKAALGVAASKDTDGAPPMRGREPMPPHDPHTGEVFDNEVDVLRGLIAKARSREDLIRTVKDRLNRMPMGPDREALVKQYAARGKSLTEPANAPE